MFICEDDNREIERPDRGILKRTDQEKIFYHLIHILCGLVKVILIIWRQKGTAKR